MPLCQFCTRIDFQAIYDGESWEHMPDATTLSASSNTCDLCRLLRASVLYSNYATFEDKAAYWLAEPIILRRQVIYLDESDDDLALAGDSSPVPEIPSTGPLQLIEIVLPVSGGQDVSRLGIRADYGPDDEQPRLVAQRAAINHSDSAAAFTRVHEWMHTCLSSHNKCNQEIHAAVNRGLPTRLHRIGLDDTHTCRLVLTEDTDVEYAALSHCWGQRQLLTTRRSNLQKHMNDIPWSELPKTFRDATTVARQLGIQYIWIDSLCIVQDDADDWACEAAKMGDVYSAAKVTIAATGAKDSSEGVFLQRPTLAEPVTVAFHGAIFELYEMPNEETGGIDNSPLDARAWITQEWLLSKRVIHYTRACMVWSCATVSETENGERVYPFDKESLRSIFVSDQVNNDVEIDHHFYEDWADIARSYCSRQLTYDNDKPVAIQGLANKIMEVTGLIYNHGMWIDPAKSSIDISQLFWYCKHPQTGYVALQNLTLAKEGLRRPSCLASEPSWSWTSTIGHIGVHIAARTALQIPARVYIEDNVLCLTTHVMPITPAHGPVMRPSSDDEWLFHQYFSRAALLRAGGLTLPHGLYYLGSSTQPGGWVSFATGTKPDGEVLCCAMSRNPEDEPGRDDGTNVLLLQRPTLEANTFVMVGIGEVLQSDGLLAQPLMKLRIR